MDIKLIRSQSEVGFAMCPDQIEHCSRSDRAVVSQFSFRVVLNLSYCIILQMAM